MKRVFVVSALLSLIVPLARANALHTENVSITETGGIVVSGGASASGTSDADASVHSVVRSIGSNTNVHVDIRTSSDGEEHATTVSKTIFSENEISVEVPVETLTEVETKPEEKVTIQIDNASVFEKFSTFFNAFFRFIVFW